MLFRARNVIYFINEKHLISFLFHYDRTQAMYTSTSIEDIHAYVSLYSANMYLLTWWLFNMYSFVGFLDQIHWS